MDLLLQSWTSGVSTLAQSLPNLRTIAQIPLLAPIIGHHHTLERSRQTVSCPNAQLSCHNSSAIPNTCCFNFPGGQFLQTQFWDTNPAVGPLDSWTVHGLWPDHCDGGFDQYCDNKRAYHNISQILESFDENALLAYMKIYWKDYQGSDPTLWSHEWNKHGTCISTLEASCYSDYVAQEEVVEYFEKTVELFKTLPTYSVLAASGVVPDESKKYTAHQIQSALQAQHGAPVTIRCRNGELDEIWYHFDVRGSIQTGDFVAAKPDGPKSNCPSHDIKYLPKNRLSLPSPTRKPTTTRQTDAPKPTPTENPSPPFRGAGFLEVVVDGSEQGCLVGDGNWYTSGTCATYHAEDDPTEMFGSAFYEDHLFTLTTRKGPCGFVQGALVCGRSVGKQDIFSATEGGFLSLKKNTTFFADGAPGHAQRAKVYSEQDEHGIALQLEWKAK